MICFDYEDDESHSMPLFGFRHLLFLLWTVTVVIHHVMPTDNKLFFFFT